jgi:putative MATE family efflux protein
MPVNMVDPQEIDPLLREPSDVPQIQKASTGQRILDLAVPAAAALLIDPLMTLADTAFVGRFSGESPDPLAGMGSAAALLRFSFYIFNFLCTATTPLISARRAAGDEKGAIEIGGQALSFAFVLGATVTVTLLTFKQPLLRIMGTSITGEDANHYALAFLSVRALAAPAVLLMEASTGIMRGYLDTKTPIFVLFGANIVNLVLDVLLIVFAGLGPMGAAIATTSAEWITAILYLAVLAGRLPSAGGELGRNRTTESGETVSVVPLLELPTFDQVKPLVVASSSVLLRTLVLQVSLSAATAMAARGGSGLTESAAASVAAHQIGIQLWLICSFFCDSLAAASQGLVADALGRKDTNAVRDVSMTVFQYSLVLGLGLALLLQVGLSTDVLSNMFTQDPLTRTALSHILPLIVLAQPLNSLVFAADGVLQGASEFPFQAKAMLVSGSTAVATFLVLEVVGKDNGTLFHVWIALIALQLVRGLTSLYKIVDRDGPIDLLNYKY